ncbi:MAG: response regulator transcription factor [Betaproteobacteria bacterium]|nr:response regulator transcription factor [Betaproteobacteria bacterium]
MLRILIVEDHALVREGLAQTLYRLDDEVEILEAGSGAEAQGLLERAGVIDLLLLDLALPGEDGFQFLLKLRRNCPEIPVVIVSAYDDAITIRRALRQGASGFVPKAYSGERLLAALEAVLEGEIYTPEYRPSQNGSPAMLPFGGYISAQDFGLTERQSEVLALVVRGCSNRDIADRLGMGEGTVKSHINAIFKALNVSNRVQALVAVTQYGIKV